MYILILELADQHFAVLLTDATLAEHLFQHRVLQPGIEALADLLATANPQGDADAVAIIVRAFMDTCILQHLFGYHQRQQLRGVGQFEDIGRQTKLHRVEIHFRDKAAALAVTLVGGFLVGVKIVCHLPAVGGHLGDGIYLVADQIPKLVQITAAGKQARHADYGNRCVFQPFVEAFVYLRGLFMAH